MINDSPQSPEKKESTNLPAPTRKQAAAIIAVAVILWIPMTGFIIFYSQDFSDRQVAAIGAVNLVVGVSVLILAYRRWIRYLK